MIMGGMDIENLFVGRRDELKLWEKVLSDPQGQAVLVVGQQGMGKSGFRGRQQALLESFLNMLESFLGAGTVHEFILGQPQ